MADVRIRAAIIVVLAAGAALGQQVTAPTAREVPVTKKVYECSPGWKLQTWQLDKSWNGQMISIYPPPPPPMRYEDADAPIVEDINPRLNDPHHPRCVKEEKEYLGSNVVTMCTKNGQTGCVDVMCYGRNIVEGCPNWNQLDEWIEWQHLDYLERHPSPYLTTPSPPYTKSHAVSTTPRKPAKKRGKPIDPLANHPVYEQKMHH